MEPIAKLFDTTTHHSSAQAQVYLQGLLSELAAKNMWRMGERIIGAKQENLQQVLSDSPWCQFAGENPPLICGSKSPTLRWVNSYHFSLIIQAV